MREPKYNHDFFHMCKRAVTLEAASIVGIVTLIWNAKLSLPFKRAGSVL